MINFWPLHSFATNLLVKLVTVLSSGPRKFGQILEHATVTVKYYIWELVSGPAACAAFRVIYREDMRENKNCALFAVSDKWRTTVAALGTTTTAGVEAVLSAAEGSEGFGPSRKFG